MGNEDSAKTPKLMKRLMAFIFISNSIRHLIKCSSSDICSIYAVKLHLILLLEMDIYAVDNILRQERKMRMLREMEQIQTGINCRGMFDEYKNGRMLKVVIDGTYVITMLINLFYLVTILIRVDDNGFANGIMTNTYFTITESLEILFCWLFNYEVSTLFFMRVEQSYITQEIISVASNLQIFRSHLPPISDPFAVIVPLYNIEQSSNGNLIQCRKGLKSLSESKRFSLNLNKIYYLQLAFFMVFGCARFPDGILSIGSFGLNNAFIQACSSTFSIVLIVFQILVCHWGTYLNNRSKIRVVERVYLTKDYKLRRHLRKFLASGRDDYPDTPCVFFNLEPGLLLMVQDVLILVISAVN